MSVSFIVLPTIDFFLFLFFRFKLNILRIVYNHGTKQCSRVSPVEYGAEDIAVTSNGEAFVSSGLGDMGDFTRTFGDDFRGRIFLFDFRKPGDALELPIDSDTLDTVNWRPHGLSLWSDKTGYFLIRLMYLP